jgi:hypothetical protein
VVATNVLWLLPMLSNSLVVVNNALEKMWGYENLLIATACDYMLFMTTFTTTYQLHQIWEDLRLMCNYYLLHLPM